MSTLRRAIPIIASGSRLLGSQYLHTSPSLGANPIGRRAPKHVQGKGPIPGVVPSRKTYDPEDSLPPLNLLLSARKSGALDIEPQKAVEILRDYQELVRKSTQGWEGKLCTNHGVSPSTLALLARILNRCPSDAQKHLARQVMLTASELGENSATYELIESALRKKPLNGQSFVSPLHRLGIMAKKENDPRAMALLGKVLISEGREKEALEWIRKSTGSGHDFEGAGEALVQEGRILLRREDKEGARVAFRRAALDLDDPSGYFYLSQLEEPGSSTQEVYLLKAASSGIVEACHNLGSLELSRINQGEKGPTSIRDFGMAREWFQVAAANGFGLSMLNMALICKAGGQPDSGLEWLGMAEKIPEVREQAKTMRTKWGNEKIEVS